MRWTYIDNIFYDKSRGEVYLHTPDEDFIYSVNKAPIGKGGMGIVVQGNSLRDNRMVAIKRVHDQFANIPEIRNRARVEAGMKFRHENLVEMLGMVESVSGRGPLFIISNFINGVNINKFVKENFSKLDTIERERKIVNLLLPVISALIYIHSYDIKHLDIKPSNIMVENGRNVRLMDLGISIPNAYDRYKPTRSSSSSGNGLMGTPKYASPEQFGISGFGEIGHRSDIYGFSVTLYELLTGNNPFTSQNLLEAIEKHSHLILPPSPLITPKLLEVLRKGAHPVQEKRFGSAKDFGEALRNVMTTADEPNGFKKILSKFGF